MGCLQGGGARLAAQSNPPAPPMPPYGHGEGPTVSPKGSFGSCIHDSPVQPGGLVCTKMATGPTPDADLHCAMYRLGNGARQSQPRRPDSGLFLCGEGTREVHSRPF